MSNLAYDENGKLVESIEFDFDEVDLGAFGIAPTEGQEYTCEDFLRALVGLFVWIHQNNDPNGIQIRSMLVAGQVIPSLRKCSLKALGNIIGKDKQSMGRWADSLKVKFPGFYAGNGKLPNK